jgi:hypothetical protein
VLKKKGNINKTNKWKQERTKNIEINAGRKVPHVALH